MEVFFIIPPKKAHVLKGNQAVLGFPQQKIVKPSDSRWLSHERCVKAICKELPPLLQTLSLLYAGHAKTYGMYSFWASINGVSSSNFFQKFLVPLLS